MKKILHFTYDAQHTNYKDYESCVVVCAERLHELFEFPLGATIDLIVSDYPFDGCYKVSLKPGLRAVIRIALSSGETEIALLYPTTTTALIQFLRETNSKACYVGIEYYLRGQGYEN